MPATRAIGSSPYVWGEKNLSRDKRSSLFFLRVGDERVSMRLTPGVGRRSISGCYCYWRSSDFRRWSETTSRIQRILYHLARSSPSTTSTPSSALSRLFRFRPSAVKFIKLFCLVIDVKMNLSVFPVLLSYVCDRNPYSSVQDRARKTL